MSSNNPLVSAIIPTKNRAALLERALQSVFDQTYENIEVVVVNDGSTDNTTDLFSRLAKRSGRPMNVISNKKSVGAAQARNQAIEAAKGEFVAGLDDDDIWHRQRVQQLLDAYSDEYAFVTSDTIMKYSTKKIRWKKKEIIDLDTLLYSNQVGNQALIRRERLLEVGGFDPELKAAQDYDLWVRLCEAYGPIFNVQQPLQTISVDHEQEQITNSASFHGYLQFYNKHKHRMSRRQRKYQLYNIRRAQNKEETLTELLTWVPSRRYLKEVKRWVADTFLRG